MRRCDCNLSLKSLFCGDISVEYEYKSEKLKGRGSIDLKLNNLDLSGNTTEFKNQNITDAPTLTLICVNYISAKESVKICRFKTFWVRIFARGTLLLFRCFIIHVKMGVLLKYCARK